VTGLRRDAGGKIEMERTRRPFRDVADLAKRVALRRDELERLAELGALASLEPRTRTRRSALWQVGAVERDARSLWAGVPPPDSDSPLAEMTSLEETLADYRLAGLTTGPQIMSHLRPALDARGVLSARSLRAARNGRFVRTAGHVIVRQRPGSAKGFCFLTLEDETGTSNAVLTPDTFRRLRAPLHAASLVEIAGRVQNVDGVVHVRVERLDRLALPSAALPASHDYR
jgi:error-prone DNA polymerase